MQLAGRLTVANVGDSRAILASVDARGRLLAAALSADHTPELPKERQRIIGHGGRIDRLYVDGAPAGPQRVFKYGSSLPGITITRAFGDGMAHEVGVTAEPEITSHVIRPEDRFLVLCSDGITEFMEDDEVVSLLHDKLSRRLPVETAIRMLIQEARQRWHCNEHGICDDITVIVVVLSKDNSGSEPISPVRVRKPSVSMIAAPVTRLSPAASLPVGFSFRVRQRSSVPTAARNFNLKSLRQESRAPTRLEIVGAPQGQCQPSGVDGDADAAPPRGLRLAHAASDASSLPLRGAPAATSRSEPMLGPRPSRISLRQGIGMIFGGGGGGGGAHDAAPSKGTVSGTGRERAPDSFQFDWTGASHGDGPDASAAVGPKPRVSAPPSIVLPYTTAGGMPSAGVLTAPARYMTRPAEVSPPNSNHGIVPTGSRQPSVTCVGFCALICMFGREFDAEELARNARTCRREVSLESQTSTYVFLFLHFSCVHVYLFTHRGSRPSIEFFRTASPAPGPINVNVSVNPLLNSIRTARTPSPSPPSPTPPSPEARRSPMGNRLSAAHKASFLDPNALADAPQDPRRMLLSERGFSRAKTEDGSPSAALSFRLSRNGIERPSQKTGNGI